MDPAIHKSLAFLALLIIGFLLKLKIKGKSEKDGIRTLILSVALPATIFVALMKIQLSGALLALPILGLVFNFALFGLASYLILPFFLRNESSAEINSYKLLLPSLAPGLSCFPFIVEYLGEESLANAALIDVGNKVFVLVILYLVAMRWFAQTQISQGKGSGKRNTQEKIKELLGTLFKEPVNIVIVLALILLFTGQSMNNLPLFVQDFVEKSHALTTGLILIFIGLAINLQRVEFHSIISVLLARSGIAFSISALILWLSGDLLTSNLALLLVIFPQSSCSFWPLAHMSAINDSEKEQKQRTFELQTGLNILAVSLPFSSLLILGICTAGNRFADPSILLLAALALFISALALKFIPGKVNQWSDNVEINWGKVNSKKKDQPA